MGKIILTKYSLSNKDTAFSLDQKRQFRWEIQIKMPDYTHDIKQNLKM